MKKRCRYAENVMSDQYQFRGLFTWTSRSRVLAAEGNHDRVSRIHWTRTGLFGNSDMLLSLGFSFLFSLVVRDVMPVSCSETFTSGLDGSISSYGYVSDISSFSGW